MQHFDPLPTPENASALLAPQLEGALCQGTLRKQIPIFPSSESNRAILDRPFNRPLVILRGKQVDTRLGSSRSARYEKLDPRSPRHDPTFPKPIRLGKSSIGFLEHEIEAYVQGLVTASRPSKNVGGSAK
jgi:prophage regulatory protein